MPVDADPHLVTTPDAYDLRFLEPARLRLFRALGVTRATLLGERSWMRVMVTRAFPISDPAHYLGLLDGAGKDIGVVRDIADLDADSRAVAEEELRLRYYLPVVRRVVSVKEEFGTVYWTVDTDFGEKDMVVRNLRDSLQEVGPSRVLVTDVEGNRYEFPDINLLDSESMTIVLRHL